SGGGRHRLFAEQRARHRGGLRSGRRPRRRTGGGDGLVGVLPLPIARRTRGRGAGETLGGTGAVADPVSRRSGALGRRGGTARTVVARHGRRRAAARRWQSWAWRLRRDDARFGEPGGAACRG